MALLAVTTGGCSGKSQLALHYVFSGLDLTAVERIETIITVDPKDMREFYADQPYRSVATGIGYEVGDFNGSTTRALALYHDGSLGWTPTAKFTFTLLPPSGESPPALDLIASAYDAQSNLSRTSPMPATFGDGNSVTLTLTDGAAAAKWSATRRRPAATRPASMALFGPHQLQVAVAESCSKIGDACSGTISAPAPAATAAYRHGRRAARAPAKPSSCRPIPTTAVSAATPAIPVRAASVARANAPAMPARPPAPRAMPAAPAPAARRRDAPAAAATAPRPTAAATTPPA